MKVPSVRDFRKCVDPGPFPEGISKDSRLRSLSLKKPVRMCFVCFRKSSLAGGILV